MNKKESYQFILQVDLSVAIITRLVYSSVVFSDENATFSR